MSEFTRVLFELLTLGRSRGALLARASLAEDRSVALRIKFKRVLPTNPKKANRILRRALFWEERCMALRARAGQLALKR